CEIPEPFVILVDPSVLHPSGAPRFPSRGSEALREAGADPSHARSVEQVADVQQARRRFARAPLAVVPGIDFVLAVFAAKPLIDAAGLHGKRLEMELDAERLLLSDIEVLIQLAPAQMSCAEKVRGREIAIAKVGQLLLRNRRLCGGRVWIARIM